MKGWGMDAKVWMQVKQQAVQALQISLGMGFFFSMKSRQQLIASSLHWHC